MADNAPFKPTKSKRSVPESVTKDVSDEIRVNMEAAGEFDHIPDESLPDEIFQPKTQTLMVQIERTYGGVTYRFGTAETVTVTSAAKRQSAYDELTAQVTAQHEHFTNVTLPKQPGFLHKEQDTQMKYPNNGIRDGNNGQTELLKYSAVALVKELNKYGKTMYKIVTSSGQYSKYGIVVWPEFLKEIGLWDEIQRVDSYPLNGVTLTVKEGGKYPVVESLANTTPEDVFTTNERDVPF